MLERLEKSAKLRTCCAMRSALRWPTRGMTPGRCKLILATRTSSTRSDYRRIGSRSSGEKFRLSDAASFEFLVEHYRTQAEACHQMARMTLSPYKEVWLELAEEWTKLVRETEVQRSQERHRLLKPS